MEPVQPTRNDRASTSADADERTSTSAHDRASTGQDTRAWRAAIRALDWALPGDNPAGAVYGTITVGALLAAESSLRETYPETIGSVVVALLVYWLAHSYAELLGRRLESHEPLTLRGLGWALGRDWAIVRGAGAPVLALLVGWAVGANQETAVTVALWICAGSLVAFELLAGLRMRTRARPAELLLQLCVGATMGVGVIVLRVILH
ncbi:MAG: hypothetical protein ACHQE6_10745 [Solirubrobacterales bacterium]